MREFPVLDSVSEKFSDKKLAVLSVNSDHSLKTINRVLEKVNTSVPILRDVESDVFKAYRAEAIPTLYLIDRQGKIYSSWVGAVNDLESQLTETINSMLESSDSPAIEKTSPPTSAEQV